MTDSAFEALLDDFALESRERLDEVEEILLGLEDASPKARKEFLVRVKRQLHTLKGNSGMMGFESLQSHAHHMEDTIETLTPSALEQSVVDDLLVELDTFRRLMEQALGGVGEDSEAQNGGEETPVSPEEVGSHSQGSVRVPFPELDSLVDHLAEIVTFRNRLVDAVAVGRGLVPTIENFAERSDEAWTEVEQSLETLQKSLGFVQERILRLRMVPLQTLFRHLRRIVHDESRSMAKKVVFETEGGGTPMDKALLELASDALGHLIRNSVIHGIETPAERLAAGKPEEGRVRLSASIHTNKVRLEVLDDGGGIDAEALRRSAERQGIDTSTLTNLHTLIFRPGVSAREEADMSAGRGIGLSAVLESVRRQGGRLEVASSLGEGSRFRIYLPLSVAISRALMLLVDGEQYALPLTSIVESMPLDPELGHTVADAGLLRWRGEVLPLLDLGRCFGTASSSRDEGYVVVIENDGRTRGLLADEIVGIRDIVVKSLDKALGEPAGVSGSTVLGDGRVIMILDPSGLIGISPGSGEPS